MHILVIYCHPHPKSHNAAILEHVVEEMKKNNVSYDVLDLYKENVQPCITSLEYERMAITKERICEDDVVALQNRVSNATHLVFIYPVWWYNMPAKLKGFLDRVFCPGFAYRFKKRPLYQTIGATIISFLPGIRYIFQPYAALGLLKGKKACIFRTYGGPKFGKRFFGHSIGVLENNVLRFCGITNIRICEAYGIDTSEYTKEKEEIFLRRVRESTRRFVSSSSEVN